jgi:hypothetical protein
MESFDFTTLTRHEIEILDDFTSGEGHLRASQLINSIMKLYQKIWMERDINAKAAQAIEFVDFSEYQGSKANNPMYSLLVLRMVLKFARDKGDEDMKKDILEKINIEWYKFLDWFNWGASEDDEEANKKKKNQ